MGYKPHLWVVSAGAGLISADDCVPAYSATFAYGHADSVAPRRTTSSEKEWWAGLSEIRINGDSNRTLDALFRRDSAALFVIALSPEYLYAISEDLLRGLRRAPNRSLVITSPSGAPRELESWCIPSVARLQSRMGGTLASLHARVAGRLIARDELKLPVAALKKKYARIAAATPAAPQRNAQRLSDDAVNAFIAEVRSGEPAISATRCLRRLRAAGLACEQLRFRDLFHKR